MRGEPTAGVRGELTAGVRTWLPLAWRAWCVGLPLACVPCRWRAWRAAGVRAVPLACVPCRWRAWLPLARGAWLQLAGVACMACVLPLALLACRAWLCDGLAGRSCHLRCSWLLHLPLWVAVAMEL